MTSLNNLPDKNGDWSTWRLVVLRELGTLGRRIDRLERGILYVILLLAGSVLWKILELAGLSRPSG